MTFRHLEPGQLRMGRAPPPPFLAEHLYGRTPLDFRLPRRQGYPRPQ
jgi:hypothetical protein